MIAGSMVRSSALERRAYERLHELCAIPSVSGDRAAVDAAGNWLLETYADAADTVDVMRAEDSGELVGLMLAFDASGDDPITFYNYFDVAPAGDPATWSSDPFTPQERDGRLFARGVGSNKGDLIARLETAASLRRYGRLHRPARVWLDGQEELGSPALAAMLDRWSLRLQGGVVLWNTGFVNRDGVPLVSLGFKGLVAGRVAAHADHAGHSGNGLGTSAIVALLRAIAPLLDAPEALLRGGPTGSQLERMIERVRESRMLEDFLEHGDEAEWTRFAPSAEAIVELRLVGHDRATFSADAGLVSARLRAPVVSVGLMDPDSAPHAADESLGCLNFSQTVAFNEALLRAR